MATRVVWRLSDPAAFERLRTTRRRARSGPLWMAWAPPMTDATPPRVAYAIGRRVGGAVVRNRLRRRLRAVLATAVLAPGDYLVGASPEAASASYADLEAMVDDLLSSLPSAPAAAAGAPR